MLTLLSRTRASLTAAARALAAGAEGTVALMFALSAVPVVVFVGAAVDYSRASDARTHLLAAADAAALAAVTPQAMQLGVAEARTAALAAFEARAAMFGALRDVAPQVVIRDRQGERTATVTFKARVPTTLTGLGGFATLPVEGESTAASAAPLYIDFHLLLDNTPSMGVGATPGDIDVMVANTPDKCAFACHDLSASGKDYYALAKKLGVTMRIDVLRSATQRLMDTAAETAVLPRQFRAAVHTFGSSCATLGLATVSPLSASLVSVKSDTRRVDLMTIPHQNFNNDQCTDYPATLAAVNRAIAPPGDGTSPSRPQKVLFFVADGVGDAHHPGSCTRPTTGGRCQEPIRPADCQAIKDRGIKIAVLYTTYLPLPTNGWYNQWIAPFASAISPRMQACASPELYFEVSPSQGIAEAMEALFQKAVSQARIAQ